MKREGIAPLPLPPHEAGFPGTPGLRERLGEEDWPISSNSHRSVQLASRVQGGKGQISVPRSAHHLRIIEIRTFQ
jgi:hypothetical protein